MNSNNSNTEFDGVRAAQSRKKGFLGLAAAIVVAGGVMHSIGTLSVHATFPPTTLMLRRKSPKSRLPWAGLSRK